MLSFIGTATRIVKADGVSTTITSDPAGSGYVLVDGAPIVTPQTYNWNPGETHTLSANSPVSGDSGVQFLLRNWVCPSTFASSDNPNPPPACTQSASPGTITYTVQNSTETLTAAYRPQYYLTVNGGSGGTVYPASGWENGGMPVTITATPTPPYTFGGWSGTGTGSYTGAANAAAVTMNSPITETASFQPPAATNVTMTVSYQADGVGPTVGVIPPNFVFTQGGQQTSVPLSESPTSVQADAGTAWSVDANPLQVRNGYTSGVERWYSSQQLTGTASATSLVFVYSHQYLLTMTAAPASGGTTTPIGASWQNAGAAIAISATATPGYSFTMWTGICSMGTCPPSSGNYSGPANPSTITVNGAISETANFQNSQQPISNQTVAGSSVTVMINALLILQGSGSSPAYGSLPGSGYFSVDESPAPTPYTVLWTVGDTHSISAISPVGCGSGCQYVFDHWSDGGAQSHTVTANNSTSTYTAYFSQVQLQSQISNSTGSAVSMTVSYTVPDGSTATPPIFQYTYNGVSQSYSLTTTPAQIAVDPGSAWTVTPNPLQGSSDSERWYSTDSLSGTASESASLVFTFYHQYFVTVSYWVSGGFGFSAPTFTANQFGVAHPDTFSSVPQSGMNPGNMVSLSDWFDTGEWAMSNVLGGSSNSERWVLISNSSSTVGGEIRSTPFVFAYHDQYALTLMASSGGYVTADNGPDPAAQALGIQTVFSGALVHDWQDANMHVTVSATPDDNYTFSGWSGDQYTGTDNPTQITMTSPLAETAAFADQNGVLQPVPVLVTVTSDPITGSGYVFVDGNPITTPQDFTWLSGSNHTLTANTPITGDDGTQYVFQGWSNVCPQGLSSASDDAAGLNTNAPQSACSCSDQSQQVLQLLQGADQNAQSSLSTGTQINQPTNQACTSIVYTVPAPPQQSLSQLTQSSMVQLSISQPQSLRHITTGNVVTAMYQAEQPVSVTVGSSPPGDGYIVVDGQPISTPTTFNWLPGDPHKLTANTPVGGANGVQYVFEGWDGTGCQDAQNTLQQANQAMDSSQQRLSTGLRINSVCNETTIVYAVPVTSQLTQASQLSQANQNLLQLFSGKMVVTVPSASQQLTQNSQSLNGGQIVLTADYKTQYYLDMNGDGASPASGWYDAGAAVQISSSADMFQSWNGSGDGSYSGTDNLTTVTMNSPITETAQLQTIQITVDSNPEGAGFLTIGGPDGTTQPITTPFVINATPGDHGVGIANLTVSCGEGCRYVFVSWTSPSIGTVLTPTINYTVPSQAETVTANYKTQYYLAVSGQPEGTAYGSDWYDAGAPAQISANPTKPGYSFTGWTGDGDGSYTGTDNPAQVTMNGPIGETANFAPATVDVTVTSSPTGSGYVKVDGAAITTPQTFTWTVGSAHTITAAPTVPCGSGCQYFYQQWNDGGAASHSITATSTTTLYTATYFNSWYLTMQATKGGTVSPASGWYMTGSTIALVATPSAGYQFSSWSGTGTGSYNGTSTTARFPITAPVTENAIFILSQTTVTVSSAPTGAGYVKVDGAAITAPQTFTWTVGSTHTLSAASVVPCGSGCQYIYHSWSDGGAASHTITATIATTAYTANFQQQYTLKMVANPSAAGTTTPAVGTTWQSAGSTVQISAIAAANYQFASWTGTGSGSYSGGASTNTATVTMNAPTTESAAFKPTVQITLSTYPLGTGYITLDGVRVTTAQVFTMFVGATHTIAAVSPVSCGTGCQYMYTNWSDGGAQSHSITVPSTATKYTANFQTQYYLTMNNATGGTTSPASGWYAAGTTVTITATPSAGYQFSAWTGSGLGSYTGTANPAKATMNGPITETAFQNVVPPPPKRVAVTITSNPAGSGYVTVDGIAIAAPQTFTWTVGSAHTITAAPTVPCGSGCQYFYQQWNDGGAASHKITITATTTLYTATYFKSWYLTMQATTGGTVSPASGWYMTGSTIVLVATPSSGYMLSSWSGTGTGSYTGTAATTRFPITAPVTENAIFAPSQTTVTVSSAPTGAGYVTVDGIAIAAPQTFTWTFGSTHILSAASVVPCGSGCQYIYHSWSDGGAQSHTVTTPIAPTIYTANFQQQYTLKMQAGPSAGGATTPTVGTTWQSAGSTVQISANAAPNYQLASWTGTGPGSYSGSTNPATFKMNAPITETANFKPTTQITISTSPLGTGYLTVDGVRVTTAQVFTWIAGSTHTIAAVSPVSCGAGCQYVYTKWSDGGAQSHTITTPYSATKYTAYFQTQYYLTMQATTGGTVSPASSAWYAAGSSITITATASGGYSFSSWTGTGTGSYSGTATTVTISLIGPITEQANFVQS